MRTDVVPFAPTAAAAAAQADGPDEMHRQVLAGLIPEFVLRAIT